VTFFWIACVLFLSAFTQSLTGFGLALVSMPLLSLLIGLRQATPLVAVISIFVEIVLLWRYRDHLSGEPVLHLILASLVGVPLGVVFLRHLPERVMLGGLGLVLAGYGAYALAGWRLPALNGRGWAWLMGLVAGALGGAYNTSGPPVILYGHAKGWPPAQFKANLQAFFLVSSSMVFLSHWLAGTIQPLTWRQAAFSMPAMAVGLWLGGQMDRLLSPERFRQIVLIALVVLGVRMVV